MHRYHIYGLGAALVDTEIEVNDDFLKQAKIGTSKFNGNPFSRKYPIKRWISL
jgi:hypothetical protein